MATIELAPAQLFDGFPEPVLLLEEGRIRYCNEAAVHLFPEVAVGKDIPEQLLVLEQAQALPATLLLEWEATRFCVSLRQTDQGRLAVFRLEGAAADVPNIGWLARGLRRETAGLTAALQRLDQPNSPITQAQAERYWGIAHQGIHRLLRLIGHLEAMDLREEALYHPDYLDLTGLYRELCLQIEGVCGQAEISFSWEVPEAPFLTVGDEALLRGLLLCLVSNAIKAAPKGPLGVKVTAARKKLVLTVWDSGVGGDPERLFRRSTLREAEPNQGLGLGMELVRRTIRLHGGTMMAENLTDAGMKVVVSLPVQLPEEEAPLRAPRVDYSGGFSPVLLELADVLPPQLYQMQDE